MALLESTPSPVFDHVVDDGSGSLDFLSRLGVGGGAAGSAGRGPGRWFFIARAHHARHERVGLLVDQQHDAAVGFHVFEHQIHDHFHDLLHVEAGAQRRRELIEDAEIRHRRRAGSGTASTMESSLDGTACMMAESMPASSPARLTCCPAHPAHARLGAEHHDRPPDADLIPKLEPPPIADPAAVDIGAVAGAEVFERPFAGVVRKQFEVPPADGVVGQRQRPAVAPAKRRLVRQFKSTPLVGALQY